MVFSFDCMYVRYFPQFIFSENFIIKRSLPVPGNIFCKPENEVKAFDVLAEARCSKNQQVVPVTEELKIKPGKIKNFLSKNIQLQKIIKRDEIIAQKTTLIPPISKKIFTPFDAIIEEINEEKGEICLHSLPEKIKLVAGISGCIERIEEGKDVFIKVSGLKIRGVLAKGNKVFGEVKVMRQGEIVGKNPLGTRILIFLDNVSLVDLEKTKALGPQAIIFSHVSKEVFSKSQLQDSQINFMILNGFSNEAFNKGDKEIFEFLDGKQAFFDPKTQSLIVAFKEKPEKIFSLQVRENLLNSEEKDKNDFVSIKSGYIVKILSPIFFGGEAKIEEVIEDAVLESQIKASAARVKLIFGDESVLVPLQNLLVIKT